MVAVRRNGTVLVNGTTVAPLVNIPVGKSQQQVQNSAINVLYGTWANSGNCLKIAGFSVASGEMVGSSPSGGVIYSPPSCSSAQMAGVLLYHPDPRINIAGLLTEYLIYCQQNAMVVYKNCPLPASGTMSVVDLSGVPYGAFTPMKICNADSTTGECLIMPALYNALMNYKRSQTTVNVVPYTCDGSAFAASAAAAYRPVGMSTQTYQQQVQQQ